jgi:GNAT superfamily N-acetyltransferase
MAQHSHADECIGKLLRVVPLGLDDFSGLRYLHATALRAHTGSVLSEVEIAAFIDLVRSSAYVDLLLKEEMYGAFLDGELVGSAGWHASADNGAVARIASLFALHPRRGIGRRLLATIEARAGACGFQQFATGVTANAVPFFQGQGYRIASRGTRMLTPQCGLPVTFLKKGAAHQHRHAPPAALM